MNFPPGRIISVVPSQTELLYDLGLGDEVKGITRFCVHPESWFRSKQRVGGTKQLKIDIIKALNPDLIIANKEENDEAQIRELSNKFPVWISDIYSLHDAIEMIGSLGSVTGRERNSELIIEKIITGFANLKPAKKFKVAYFIWKNPYMVAAGNTFINDILEQSEFENVFKNKSRYPEVSLEELKNLNCDFIFLSSEPYPFKEQHLREFSEVVPNTKPVLVDGELFSWYGSRLILTAKYLEKLSERLVMIEK